jgi:hypothetical protein
MVELSFNPPLNKMLIQLRFFLTLIYDFYHIFRFLSIVVFAEKCFNLHAFEIIKTGHSFHSGSAYNAGFQPLSFSTPDRYENNCIF